MYKLLIIDDEEIVRQGLNRFVDWGELGFEITGDLGSAVEALDFIEMEEVDVILTDIKMPDMDGLTLIEEIRKRDINIKTVILSGYGEFEYAKRAIRLGAYDFLTKPVNFDELRKIFNDIRVILDEEGKENRKKKEYFLLEKERFLNNLSKGYCAGNGSITARFAEAGIVLEEMEFRFIRFYISSLPDTSEKDKDNYDLIYIKQKLSDLIQEYLADIGRCHVFNNDINELSVLLYSDMNENEMKECLEKLQEDITDRFNTVIHIGAGKVYKDIALAPAAYEEAGRALEYRVFKKLSSILFYNDVCKFFKGRSVVNDEVRSNILAFLAQADGKGLEEYIDSLFTNVFECGNININMLYDSFAEIILIINKYISGIDESFPGMDNQYGTMKAFLEKESLEDMRVYMGEYIKNSILFIKSIKETTSGRIVENAKKYISMHYAEEITLNKLSEILYVHPIYLSKQFKEKTGENFIDYLIKVRVEKSKELLADFSLKIYEISEMIGYESSKYFSKIFKEIVGLTPKEYRDSIVL